MSLSPTFLRPFSSIARCSAAWATLIACAACSTFDNLSVAKSNAETCVHALPQPIRNTATVPGETEFTVAGKRFAFIPPDGGLAHVGFDLDNRCTGQGEGSNCRAPSWAGTLKDYPGGRDDAVIAYLVDAGVLKDQAKQATDGAQAGIITMMLRVSHYNGSDPDGDVAVEVIAGTRSPNVVAQVPNKPKWDGTDEWKPEVDWVDPALKGDGRDGGAAWKAKYISSRAYVAGGVVVAHFDFAMSAPTFHFSNVWVQARIIENADGTRSLREGVFTGRAKIDDILAENEFAPDPQTGVGHTCTDSPGYPQMKRNACSVADVRYERDDPNEECDAASWALTFEAEPAKLANEIDPTTFSDFHVCPAGKRPSEDHCATLDRDAAAD